MPNFYIISTILFIVGSAVCGAAPNINALIVGRVITGIEVMADTVEQPRCFR